MIATVFALTHLASQLFDEIVPVGVVALDLSQWIGVPVSLGVIALEAILLRWIDLRRSWTAAFLRALYMNAASTAVGIVVAVLYVRRGMFAPPTRPQLHGPQDWSVTDVIQTVEWLPLFLVLLVTTVLLEAAVLFAIERDRPWPIILRDAAAVNAVGYVVVVVTLLWIATWIGQGPGGDPVWRRTTPTAPIAIESLVPAARPGLHPQAETTPQIVIKV